MIRRGTYSMVAHDPATGAVGAAVQSHWFGVGSVVPWARAGVGAVATQSIAEPSYGPRLLDRLAAGEAPRAALDALLAADELAAFRQVAVVDAEGRVAVHTGERCIGFAGHQDGDGFSAQANMMASAEVWPAMAHAFERAAGPLPRRLLAALHAAEAQGGDARGRQSAALVVVPPEGEPWRTAVDLRVEDDPEPLEELDRLADLRDAYDLATEGDELTGAGRHEEAGDRYERASALAPDNHELLFWAGLAAAQAGDLPMGLRRVERAIELQPGWRELLGRLEPDVAPGAATVRAALEGR
jgi:uncharacterized Ntn-hydrolase superfamily protein